MTFAPDINAECKIILEYEYKLKNYALKYFP